ncbi:MAG: HigA family addiction module antidote protein [Armatimonadetes bacterium]|nr:HigA family addiction module antidote protein [Armatimonadota bacterium]
MDDRQVAEAFPPGEFIREELEARGWSQAELAEVMGRSAKDVSHLISGKRAISPEIAMELEAALGPPAQHWLNLESTYRLWRLRSGQDSEDAIRRRARLYAYAPIKEMAKRNWIEPSESVEVMESRLKRYFGVSDLDEEPRLACAARRGTREISPAQVAWLFRAKHLAEAVWAEPFSSQSLAQGTAELRSLLSNAPDVRRVPKVLSDAGIRFLVLEQLPGTKIDGVAFWLDPRSPVIALSLRWDRLDWFWFTLAHEVGHIKQVDNELLDIDLVGENARPVQEDSERNANEFAEEFLIDRSELDRFIARVGPLYGTDDIVGFARRIRVHPGIVVGQLQHRGEVPWSHFRSALQKVRQVVLQSAMADGWGRMAPALA